MKENVKEITESMAELQKTSAEEFTEAVNEHPVMIKQFLDKMLGLDFYKYELDKDSVLEALRETTERIISAMPEPIQTICRYFNCAYPKLVAMNYELKDLVEICSSNKFYTKAKERVVYIEFYSEEFLPAFFLEYNNIRYFCRGNCSKLYIKKDTEKMQKNCRADRYIGVHVAKGSDIKVLYMPSRCYFNVVDLAWLKAKSILQNT